jgi:hypothetical protein
MRLSRITIGLAAAAIAALAGGGYSLAYFTSPGEGSGTAAAASATQPVSITPGEPAAQLFPGGSGAAALRISNPNSVPVHVGSLALTGWAADGDHADCVDPDLTLVTPQTNNGTGWTVPAGETLAIELEDAVGMGADAEDACQDAVFTVDVYAGA